MPPNGEKTVADKEARIYRELGKLPVMLDFSEFLSLSDMKRHEFIYALTGSRDGTDIEGKEAMIHTLSKRLQLPETADPQEINALALDIAECVDQYGVGSDIQTGLQAMLEYAKEMTSYWKKERDKAAGAAQKISEYKNDLAETDRNLDANSKRLNDAQKELTQVAVDIATTVKENQRLNTLNASINALKGEIAKIEAETNTSDIGELRGLIAQYSADIQHVNHSALIVEVNARVEATRGQLTTLEKAVEQFLDDNNAVNAKKTANETLIVEPRIVIR